MASVNLIKNLLRKEFKMKDLGNLQYCLGIQIHYDKENHTIKLFQTDFVTSSLKQYNMSNSKSMSTPMEYNLQLDFNIHKNDVHKDDGLHSIQQQSDRSQSDGPHSNVHTVDVKHYQQMIGSLIYLTTRTRPDLSYAFIVLDLCNLQRINM